MRQSEQVNELNAALAKAQGAFKPIHKNKTMKISGRPDYHYADLSEIIKTLSPDLSINGLSISQMEDILDGQTVLWTVLGHSSGQWRAAVTPLREAGKLQDHGSALSYKRRYAYQAIVSVFPDDDVDGHALSQEPEGKHEPRHVHEPKPIPAILPKPLSAVKMDHAHISEEEWKRVGTAIKTTLNMDKDGIYAFVLKHTGKTTPRTLTHTDVVTLENALDREKASLFSEQNGLGL